MSHSYHIYERVMWKSYAVCCILWITYMAGISCVAECDMHSHIHNMSFIIYSRSRLGWHFRMLFQSSKLKARTSLLPRFSEKRRSSSELWALKQHSKMSPQVGLAVLWMIYYECVNVYYEWHITNAWMYVTFIVHSHDTTDTSRHWYIYYERVNACHIHVTYE